MRRASDPKAPATLLIELLRAYIPEEFSRSGHKCDTSKSDEILRRFREDARRELEAGHPTLRKIAEGATNAPPNDDHVPSYSNLSPTPGDPHDSNLSPAGGEIQRGGSLHTDPHAHQPSPDDIQPRDACETLPHEPTSANRHTGGGRYPVDVPPSPIGPSETRHTPSPPDPHEGPHHHDNPTPRHGTVPPLARRERLTQHQSLPRRGRDTERGALPRPAPRATPTTKKSRKEKTPSP